MIDYMQKGGPLMWLILFCSVVAGGVFFERVSYFYRASIRVGEFMRGLANLIQHQRWAEAQMECAATPAPVTRVLHAAILHHAAPRAELKEIVQEAGQLEVPRLERRLAVLATIALVTPLIGLLGTVAGLIEAFVNISSQSGFASATDISGGIYQSLLTTAAGLVVAIPCSVAYAYLSSRVNALMHDMERAGIEVVNLIAAHRATAGIIEFGGARPASAQGGRSKPARAPFPPVPAREAHPHAPRPPGALPGAAAGECALPRAHAFRHELAVRAPAGHRREPPLLVLHARAAAESAARQRHRRAAARRSTICNHQVSLEELDAQLANGPAEKRSLIIKADRNAPVRPRRADDEPRAAARLLRRARHRGEALMPSAAGS